MIEKLEQEIQTLDTGKGNSISPKAILAWQNETISLIRNMGKES
jgi:hypothetical protein